MTPPTTSPTLPDGGQPDGDLPDGDATEAARRDAYWRANLRYLGALLTVWFAVSYGAGILFVEQLDTVRLFGFQLGFWFAQQGSIYVFVVLILIYVKLMNRLDRRFGFEEIPGDERR